MAEGGNINRPPLFDGTNYAYWKVRMRAFLIAIDERVWQSIEFGWKHPIENEQFQYLFLTVVIPSVQRSPLMYGARFDSDRGCSCS